jgi:hypothetical protein
VEAEHLQLPEGEARERLLMALANLIQRSGWERFVTQPLLQPTPQFFPDSWNRSVRGAYRLSRRLLVYAGLDDRDIDLLVFRTTADDVYRGADGSSYPEGPEHAAATYRGTSDEAHHFGIEVRQLLEDETLAAAMCHEVSHAFRAAQGLVVTTSAIEEQLTDLTTVYLGFGLLTLNGAYRYRTRRLVAGHEWKQSTLGYLGAGDLALLFAAQIVARGIGPAEVKKLADQMEVTQGALFRQAVSELEGDREGLVDRLGLPAPDTWPPVKELAPFLKPLDLGRDEHYEDTPPKEVTPRDIRNDGNVVFRVRIRKSTPVAMLGALVALIPTILLAAHGYQEAGWLVAGGFVGGYLLGHRLYHYICSDPNCEANLEKDAQRCPRCGGVVRGTIASANKRLQAEEDLENGVFRSLD